MKPPALGAGVCWLIRSIDWKENIDGEIFSRSVLLFNDSEVREEFAETYFEALLRAEKGIVILNQAGKKPPYVFCLRDAQDQFVGAGLLAVGDRAHHVAWLFCFFLELGFHMCLSVPKGTPGAKLCESAPLDPEARRCLEAIVNGE